MINLATRQIYQSDTFKDELPEIAPTTLGSSVNSSDIVSDFVSTVSKKAFEAILMRTYPVSIVDLEGSDVVLSQGGQSIAEGGRYKVYLQGKEMRDPQTGQSLGFTEKLCCELVISRVTPQLSYGALEKIAVDLTGVQAGSLQVREAIED
jgi:hypothetical protein